MTVRKNEIPMPITTELAKEFIREEDNNSYDIYTRREWDAIINNIETGVWDREALDKNLKELEYR